MINAAPSIAAIENGRTENGMSAILGRESELRFELGGPAYRLMQKIGLIQGEGPSIGRRVGAFLLITWVPLLIFSLLEGRAIGPTARESFLSDFATYARFFLTVPLLFLGETIAGPRLRAAGLNFIRGGFVRLADMPAVEAAVIRSRERREAVLPEAIMLGIGLLGAWFTIESWGSAETAATWSSITQSDGSGLSLTGLWYHGIAIPILQFFALRWLWRLWIWSAFLFTVARVRLNMVGTHADSAGGLGFLGGAHTALAIFPFAVSCILSGHIGFQLWFEGASIETYEGLLVVYLILVELVCLGPLLMFVPLLARTRRQALGDYSVLVDTYNRSFHRKWLNCADSPAESLLGSADIQSLADLGNSYRMIQEMKMFPFSLRQILQVAVIACLPLLPLAFLVIPVGELMKLLAGALL